MFKYFSDRLKLFTIWDFKLGQLASMFILIILIKLVPQIITLDMIWYIIMGIVFAIRPLYLILFKQIHLPD